MHFHVRRPACIVVPSKYAVFASRLTGVRIATLRRTAVRSELAQTTADNNTTSIPSAPAKSPSFVTNCEHRCDSAVVQSQVQKREHRSVNFFGVERHRRCKEFVINDQAKRRAVLWRVRLSAVLWPERQHTRLSDDESFAGIAFDVLSLRT